MKDPCANCKNEWPGCRRICPFGVAYQDELRQKRETAKTERHKELAFSEYKFDRIQETIKKIER
jgi:Fe-S-cluster-containing hydrogenase component 2